MRNLPRRGLTLLELLVVVGIIAVLLALLLPAVQKARETANRTQCINNLHQLGLALQAYHDVNKSFPWGGSDDHHGPGGYYRSLPWGVYILPYLEQQNLYQRFKVATISGSESGVQFNGQSPSALGITSPYLFNNPPNNTNTPDPAANPAATPLKVYRCPSSPSPVNAVYSDTWTNQSHAKSTPVAGSPSWTVAVSDYVVVAGVVIAMRSNFDLGDVPDAHGVLNDDQVVAIKDITDGTTNTWMVGEAAGAPNVYVAGPRPYGSYPPTAEQISANLTVSGLGWADGGNGDWWITGNNPDGLSPGNYGPCVINCTNAGAGFFAFHSGGANFLYADGHVQFVPANIATNIALLLAMYQDGLPIPAY
jgi:prepilin-type processing-associated H-X9-DG protein/prepilin-type N-terminal cleavage/methylation domain-containing protein